MPAHCRCGTQPAPDAPGAGSFVAIEATASIRMLFLCMVPKLALALILAGVAGLTAAGLLFAFS
jgi:hypothetical protein